MTRSTDRTGRWSPGRRPTWGALTGSVVFSLLGVALFVASAEGEAVLQYQLSPSVTGVATLGPLAAATTNAGAGGCASTATGTVPFGAGSSRGSASVVEPHGCATRTLLTFLPPLHVTNGLAVTAGHVFDARVDLLTINGTTVMLRSVQLYLQRIGGGNPIVTGTHATVTNGAITTAQSSVATLAAATTYGVGVRERLNRQGAVSAAQLNVMLTIYLFDAGRVESLTQERVTILLFY